MIKRKFIYGLATIALVTTFVACNKDEDKKEEPQTQQEIIKDLSVETQAVALIIGENSEVTISDGNGTYTITSADENIAVASISNNKIKIEAKKDGETFLTLKDAKGKEQRISVKIFKILGVAESQTTLKIRSEKQIDIAGNGEFEASVDNTNATAEIQADKVKITAASVGASVVTIKDKKSGKTTTINVTIEDYPAVEVTENQVEIFVRDIKEISISGGASNFSAEVNNQNVTTVIENSKVKITAVSVGTSEVKIKDETAQKEVTIQVTVKDYPAITVSDTSITMISGVTKEISISGGIQETYTATTNNNNVVAEIEGKKVLIEAVSVGTSVITVKGEESQKTATINVTITHEDLNVDTTEFSVKGNLQSPMKAGEAKIFNITAGSGQYEVNANNNNIRLEKISDTQYKVHGNTDEVAGGRSTITIKDTQSNKTKTIQVTILGRFRIHPTIERVKEGKTTTIEYYGQEPTAAVFVNSSIAEVVNIGSTNAQGRGEITIKGLRAGRTNVTFQQGDDTHTMTIEVEATPTLTVVNSDIWMSRFDDEKDLQIKGSGNFQVTFEGEEIAAISNQIDDSELNHLGHYIVKITRITGKSGTGYLIVKDTDSGQTKRVKITVRPK